ncbi:MAG: DUF357 domain-containing protein [Thermoprotei archaeon]|nr:DUF357 domain-containing protein [Thermoprotei archaeon]
MAWSRVEKYIANVRGALRELNIETLASKNPGLDFKSLVDAVSRYASDAEYYLRKGDVETALAAASYAEGLLDALRYLNISRVEWPSEPMEEKRVFLGGTFDIIHPGHVELLEFASRLGKVHVAVARDVNVARIKGREPLLDENSRLKLVSSMKHVYNAFLGDPEDIYKSLEAVKPHVIVLGPDQPFKEEQLALEAERRLGYKPEILRYPEKRAFSGSLQGSRDIVKAICQKMCRETV